MTDYDPAWHHSEIARLFIEASAEAAEQECGDGDGPAPLKAVDVETAPDGAVEVELAPKKAEAEPDHQKISAEFDTWRAQQALVRLAAETAKNGNLKAAYLIERLLTKLDSE